MRVMVALLGMWFSAALWGADVVVDESYVRFVSIKKNAIAEVSEFSRIKGSLSSEGEFRLDVDLSSVATQIDVRDQRMRDFLFETVRFPAATVQGRVDVKPIDALAVGQELTVPVKAMLTLHGFQQELQADVRMVRLASGALRVTTVNPLLLSLKDFGLEEGVDKLQALAELPSIARVVPVYFSLLFQ